MAPAPRFPVVTGVGIIGAPGCGISQVWRALASHTSGLRPLSLFPSPRYGQLPAGEVQADLCALGAPTRASRSDRLAWLAAREALASAAVDLASCAERGGCVLGCSVGGSFDSERFLTTLLERKRMRSGPTRFHECVSSVDLIAGEFGLLGPSMAISTACSSGALAIATAAEFILADEADVMLAGGADSLSRMTWGGFHSLLLVDGAGCRPFDKNRAGMSLGEGAAVLVLEAEEIARRRGATILARLTGWGTSCDAHHATAPHPQGAGAAGAMQGALSRAGLTPTAIDYVNTHGTGTRDNDLAEARALRAVFGSRVPPFSSTKHFFGHALAASGAIEAVVCIEALRRQQLPPNLGFSSMDPAIGLEPVTRLQSASLTHVMSNSFGFGGNNAVLIFSQPGTVPMTRLPQPASPAVTNIGVVGPGSVSIRQIEPPLPPGNVTVFSCGAFKETAQLTANQRRRLSRLVQMALVAARHGNGGQSAERTAVAVGTGMGCLEDAGSFIENLLSKQEREQMPTRFSGSVHNAAASQIAIDLKAQGLNSAPTAGEISFESALWQGMTQLAIGEANCALVGAIDELNKYLLSIGSRWGLWTERTRPGEGAVVARLARNGTQPREGTALARVLKVRLGRYRRPFAPEREAAWIGSTVDVAAVDVLLSGAGGWAFLDPFYEGVIAALSARAGRTFEHQTYKQICGEFHAASAFGFSVAIELVRQRRCRVLLYTLGLRGAKALSLVGPT